MPRIADYSVIRDNNFEIKTGGDIDRDFNFTMPSSAHLPSRSILAFRTDTKPNANNLKLQITINRSPVLDFRLSGDTFMTLHEVVSGNTLKVGSNTINFKIVGGSGTILIADVVLWWQRDV